MLRSLMPDEREVRGLLALLLVNDARRATRTDTDGRLVLLEDQDRSRWDGLAEIEALERDSRLAGYRYLPAAKADLLRRLGRRAEAADAYRAALELADNDSEREFLAARLAAATG